MFEILTLNHENRFLNLDALDFVRENWEWIEAELLQVTIALLLRESMGIGLPCSM